MMSVNRIAEYNTEMYQKMQIKNTERRLDELRLEERRNKHLREVTEQARIEMNRKMNRPGQNVDKLC